MSSFYRDIAQTMESIYYDIKRETLEDLPKEELIKLLRHVQEDAKESYVSYSVHMGWYSSSEEAEKELEDEEEVEQEQESEEDFLSHPLYRFELTEWMTKQKRFTENEIIGHLVEERDKACFIFITKPVEHQSHVPIWLPKSQIITKEEITSIEM